MCVRRFNISLLLLLLLRRHTQMLLLHSVTASVLNTVMTLNSHC